MSARRGAILREMGLGPIWRLRSAHGAVGELEPPVSEEGAVRADAADAEARVAPSPRPPSTHAAPAAAAARPRRAEAPSATAPAPQARPSPPAPATAETADSAARRQRIAALDWDGLEADIRACRACRLCERRKQAVPGVGDRAAEWLFVGEGPGAEEDARGEPFVGAAGRLLDNMLAAIGLQRGEGVYIANAVKCRPPHNRTPEADEMASCRPYLERQIALIRPRLIVALGRPAAQSLLGGEIRIGAARGQAFRFGDIPLVVTYHPAYLLRNQPDKAKAWEDLCFARRLMEEARRAD